MFLDVWRAVAGREFNTIEGLVAGYSVYRVADADFPGMVAAERGVAVRGVVHLDVDDAAIARLDRFEGDLYVRTTLTISCVDGRDRMADAFVVPADRQTILTTEPWTLEAFVAAGGLDRFIRNYPGFAGWRSDVAD
jgi:hypothetical protein